MDIYIYIYIYVFVLSYAGNDCTDYNQLVCDMCAIIVYNYVVVVVNHCFTSLFGTKGLLSDIVIR